jgi:hypothetical protein
MNKIKIVSHAGQAGIVFGAAILLALAPCVSSANGQGVVITGGVTPPVVVAPVALDDYVYYPTYGIYYSVNHHRYAYLKNRAWVSESAPFGVTVDALRTAPSVKMDFHDSPANHHAAIVRQYPKEWKPARAEQKSEVRDEGGKK